MSRYEDWKASLRQVAKSPHGKLVLYSIMGQCNTFGESYAHDPLITTYNEGKRSIGCWLRREIMAACPEDLMKMLIDADNREKMESLNGRNHAESD